MKKYLSRVKTLGLLLLAVSLLFLSACFEKAGNLESQSSAPTEPATPGESQSADASADPATASATASAVAGSSEAPGAGASMQAAEGYAVSTEITDLVDILMDSGQHMVLKLRPDAAPKTVENFQKLVQQGFYNGLMFHRIIPGFMIQGGDPEGTGLGGSPDTIPGEFAENGIENPLSHQRGTLSMARRSDDPDSASSQFFICHAAAPYLDGKYAAFGELVYGEAELDRIAALKTGTNDRPKTPPVMVSVFFVTEAK